MTFVVNTIKQESGDTKKPQNIQLLLDLDSPLFARKFIEDSGLILLSLNDYNGDIHSFGPLYVNVAFENKEVRVIGTKDFNLKNFFLLFLGLGFEILDGNYFVDPQTPDQIKKVIDICKKEIEAQKESKDTIEKQTEENERKIYYQDEGLEKAKNVIAWSLEKVNSLLVDKGAFVSAKDLRTIKIKVEELKKMRMGTNYEKIRDMLQELFLMVDRIEEDYYASLQDSSQRLFDGTSVTTVDLERQISILEKVQQQQMFGGTVSVKRKDYVAFGEVLIYLIFLKKDFIELFQKIRLYVYRIFDFLQLGLIMILVFLGGSVVYFSVISSTNQLNTIYYSFFTLGFMGLINFLFSYIKAKNPLFVGILFVIMVVLYFVSISVLKHTFALS